MWWTLLVLNSTFFKGSGAYLTSFWTELYSKLKCFSPFQFLSWYKVHQWWICTPVPNRNEKSEMFWMNAVGVQNGGIEIFIRGWAWFNVNIQHYTSLTINNGRLGLGIGPTDFFSLSFYDFWIFSTGTLWQQLDCFKHEQVSFALLNGVPSLSFYFGNIFA